MLATPLHVDVLETYLLSYLGTYLFTRLLTRYILQPLLYKLSEIVLVWLSSGQHTIYDSVLWTRVSTRLGSRSFKVIEVGTTAKNVAVLVMISSMSVSICNRFDARWANCGKRTISKGGGTPLSCRRSRGISSPSGTKIIALETRDSRLSYADDPESVSHLALNPYRVVTDGQTYSIPI